MKKLISFSVMSAFLLMGSVSLYAKQDTLILNSKKNAMSKEIELQRKSFKKVGEDIQIGMQNTFVALNALKKNKTKVAKKALKKATEAFDSVLKQDARLRLIPIEQSIKIDSIKIPLSEIKSIVKDSIKLLKESKVQDAKELLLPLTDEINIQTVSLPMDLYPIATKEAYEDLKKGDTKKAIQDLLNGENTIVHTKVVIPLGLVTAQDLILAASKLEKTKKAQAKKLLEASKKELEKAKLLGYFSKNNKEYKNLISQIQHINEEIDGKNMVEKLYDKVKESFSALLNKTRNKKSLVGVASHKKAEEKVLKFENSQTRKAIQESKEFLKKSMKDKSQSLGK